MVGKDKKWMKSGESYKKEEKIRIVGGERCEEGQKMKEKWGII